MRIFSPLFCLLAVSPALHVAAAGPEANARPEDRQVKAEKKKSQQKKKRPFWKRLPFLSGFGRADGATGGYGTVLEVSGAVGLLLVLARLLWKKRASSSPPQGGTTFKKKPNREEASVRLSIRSVVVTDVFSSDPDTEQEGLTTDGEGDNLDLGRAAPTARLPIVIDHTTTEGSSTDLGSDEERTALQYGENGPLVFPSAPPVRKKREADWEKAEAAVRALTPRKSDEKSEISTEAVYQMFNEVDAQAKKVWKGWTSGQEVEAFQKAEYNALEKEHKRMEPVIEALKGGLAAYKGDRGSGSDSKDGENPDILYWRTKLKLWEMQMAPESGGNASEEIQLPALAKGADLQYADLLVEGALTYLCRKMPDVNLIKRELEAAEKLYSKLPKQKREKAKAKSWETVKQEMLAEKLIEAWKLLARAYISASVIYEEQNAELKNSEEKEEQLQAKAALDQRDKQLDSAIQCLEKAKRLYRRRYDMSKARIKIWRKSDKPKAQKKSAELAELYGVEAYLYKQKGDTSKAGQKWDKALACKPSGYDMTNVYHAEAVARKPSLLSSLNPKQWRIFGRKAAPAAEGENGPQQSAQLADV